MEEAFVLNVTFEGDSDTPEIFRLPKETEWCDLEAMLKAQFDCSNLVIIYIDTDGDYITLSSQEELLEAHKVAKKCSNTLHLKVRDLGESLSSPSNAEKRTGGSNEVDSEQISQIPTTDKNETGVKIAPASLEIIRDTNDCTKAPSEPNIERDIEETANRLSEVVIHVDRATGEVTETKPEQKDKPVAHKTVRDEETGATFTKQDEQPVVKKKKRDPFVDPHFRVSQSADRSTKSKRRAYDSDSGETADDDNAMPFGVFIKYMEELKKELHCEIVKDVTRKTVKQVLKGLDGAVIQTVKGSEGGPNSPITTALPKTEMKKNLDPNSSHPIYYHTGVMCNFCERVIVGSRYKCCNCADYDLCEECEAIHGVHDSNHVFIKLRKPIKLQKKTALMKNILYKMYQPVSSVIDDDSQVDSKEEEATPVGRNLVQEKFMAKMEKLQAKVARKQEKIRQKEERIQEKQRKKEERLKRRLESRRDEPMKREKLDLDSYHLYTNLMSNSLYDVTIPDGTKVQPGTKLIKTWKMRNTGQIAWRDTTKLCNVYGTIPTPFSEVEVPLLQPGEVGDISVQLQAPENPGKYQSHWKLKDSGYQFGHRVWCEIIVEPKQVLEPTRTDSLKLLSESGTIREEPEGYQEQSDIQLSSDQTEVDDQAKVEESFVIEKKSEEEHQKESEVKTEDETKEDEEEDDALLGPSDDAVAKVVQDLSTAAAAVAQLKLDHQQNTVSSETGQDLMSFEMLDLVNRGPAKVSQTATPNNTPLVMSPPKSPAPELLAERSLSRSSSVELVNAETEEEEEPVDIDQYVQECMNALPTPKPDEMLEDDQISYHSFDSTDNDSLSEDEDFLIVPLPACFDISKPLKRSKVVNSSEIDEEVNLDDNHNTITNTGESREVSVDEILTTSNSLTTPPLDPLVTTETKVTDIPQIDIVTSPPTEQTVPDEADTVAARQDSLTADTSSGENEIGASGDVELPPTNTETGEITATNTAVHTQSGSMDQDNTDIKEPLPETYNNGNIAAGTNDDKTIEQPQGATAGNDTGDNRPSEMVNQMMNTAVKAANCAAAKAYTTCKEVFYTWQARTYQPASGKQNAHKWQKKNATFVPPKSTWKPKGDTWVPPKSTWTPGKETGPMGKLLEMGFCDREENKTLLEKHNNDVEAVVQELLKKFDNNWASSRH